MLIREGEDRWILLETGIGAFFDPALREPFTEFFTQAFRRNISERFDNAEEMLRAWRECFAGLEEPGPFTDHAEESQLRDLLAEATFDSASAATLVPTVDFHVTAPRSG